ncbi:O-antigen ligase family protein, partial [Candidatus Saccharibacteria bacterium]|nr:O-antigen ligase family protein [Candidatus Saccharibacteria bacterium]
MKNTKPIKEYLTQFSYWVFIGLLAYMPLHIFLSTWIGTTIGILEATRILKDILMILGFVVLVSVSFNQKWFKQAVKSKLIWLIIAYGVWTLILALIKSTDQDAEILGLVYNTRFLVFFLYALLLTKADDAVKLRKYSLIAVMSSALFVLVFGIMQYTIIPNNTLEHFGYQRQNGVLPAFFIDDKPNLERIMSTLRDPNSFGSYVIIIASIALVMAIKKPKYKDLALGFLGLSVLCLWFSFSRSAWIGFIFSSLTIAILLVKEGIKPQKFKLYLILAAILLVTLFSGLILARNTYFVKNVVFHADESTVLEDPNELRIRFWRESVEDIANNPMGSGPGTAGLASIRNDVQGTKLNENYYLQIATEAGVIGLVIFVSILILVAINLYNLTEKDWLAIALLASLVGLGITNFLVHIWSNEAVAYTWWGLAGLVTSKHLFDAKKTAK